jgi:polysaccharide pyruvyl transferase WcaK-like protein
VKKITVGILGAALNNGNLGVNALGFCLIDLLANSANKHNKNLSVVFFSTDKEKDISLFLQDKVLEYSICSPISLKKPKVFSKFVSSIKKCDMIIDITGGDSFSDIYGENRFIRETVGKFIAEHYSRIILAPQTIGPFKNRINTFIAAKAMNRAGKVFARDKISYDIAKKITKNTEINLVSDIAFLLPYDNVIKIHDTKTKIGLNINALMWNGGYNRDNQFGLSLDYKKYIFDLLDKINYESDIYHVYLVPHVVHHLDVENDLAICQIVEKQFPELCTLVGPFITPMAAKNVIKDMDVFIGGRMHSTIAAISTCTPVIPVSYSRKFEGLFNSIGYECLVNCRELNTENAVQITLDLIKKRELLRKKTCKSKEIAIKRLNAFVSYLDNQIENL